MTATDTEQQNEQATDETTDEQRDEAMPDGLTEGGKAAIAKEREARKQAAKEAREAKAELQRLLDEKTKRDEEDRIAAEKIAEEQGQFKELAAKRAEELTAVTGERDSLKARLDQAEKLLKTSVDERWNDVPAEVAETYEGDADDPLERLAFIDKNQKIIAALKSKEDAKLDSFRRASGTRTPNPDTSGKQKLESPLSAREIRGG